MDKKNRTGLQSKISNIFAGVPVPKKSKSLSEHTEPEKKEETSELSSPVIENVVEDDNLEAVFSQQDQVEKTLESSIEQQSEVDLSEEQFTIVEEPDITDDVSHIEESADKKLHEKTISDSESLSNDSGTQAQQPVKEESKEDKMPVKKTIPAIPIKEPIDKKTVTTKQENEMPGMPNAMRTPKPLVNNIPNFNVKTKKSKQFSKKPSLKSKSRNIKSKTSVSQPRQTKMVVLFIVGCIILVLVLLKNFGFFETSSGNSKITEQSGSLATPITSTGNMIINWSPPSVYPDELRDPMMETDETDNVDNPGNKAEFVVTVISIVDGQYLATIDGERKRTGDMVGNAKIIEISEDYVVFEKDGKIWNQTIGQERN
ncbi:MAG: hypothetical protein JXA96_05790 [Sedimentisphaerales bacterium]|nr:hypothetical protein [Sedimentisphaerales bacterium]